MSEFHKRRIKLSDYFDEDVAECLDCEGTGQIEKTTHRGNQFVVLDCTACGGTGKISKEDYV